MPLTRSEVIANFATISDKRRATIQHMGRELVALISSLADYLKELLTSEHPDWMNHIREYNGSILEKLSEFCSLLELARPLRETAIRGEIAAIELAWAVRESDMISSVEEDILKAVEITKLQTSNIMYGIKASILETLETVEAKMRELNENNDQ